MGVIIQVKGGYNQRLPSSCLQPRQTPLSAVSGDRLGMESIPSSRFDAVAVWSNGHYLPDTRNGSSHTVSRSSSLL